MVIGIIFAVISTIFFVLFGIPSLFHYFDGKLKFNKKHYFGLILGGPITWFIFICYYIVLFGVNYVLTPIWNWLDKC